MEYQIKLDVRLCEIKNIEKSTEVVDDDILDADSDSENHILDADAAFDDLEYDESSSDDDEEGVLRLCHNGARCRNPKSIVQSTNYYSLHCYLKHDNKYCDHCYDKIIASEKAVAQGASRIRKSNSKYN